MQGEQAIVIPHDSKILLVEDSELNQIVVMEFLKRMGLEALMAENGKLALDMIEKEKPDIIFMDIHMPEMDGIEAITQLRRKYHKDELPVIALTADAFQQQDKTLYHGFNDIIVKPITSNVIKKTLTKYL